MQCPAAVRTPYCGVCNVGWLSGRTRLPECLFVSGRSDVPLLRRRSWFNASSPVARKCSSGAHTRTEQPRQLGARFSTFEDAIRYHKKISWSPRYLDPTCVDKEEFRTRVQSLGVTYSEKLWHRTCLLACLGMEIAMIDHLLSTRGNKHHGTTAGVLIEKLSYMHDVLGMDRETLVRLSVTHSRLWDYSLQHTIKSRVEFFCEYFQVDAIELGTICAKHPRMLWAHMDLDIKAKIQLLNGVVGDPSDVVSMLRRQPSILAVSEVTIQEKLCALVELLGLQPRELSQVLRRAPSLLNRRVPNLRAPLQVLLRHLGDLALVRSVVVQYAQVLTYKQETLEWKLACLRREFGFRPDVIASNPSLIGYSIDKRIRPRVHRLRGILAAVKSAPRNGKRRLTKPSPAQRMHVSDIDPGAAITGPLRQPHLAAVPVHQQREDVGLQSSQREAAAQAMSSNGAHAADSSMPGKRLGQGERIAVENGTGAAAAGNGAGRSVRVLGGARLVLKKKRRGRPPGSKTKGPSNAGRRAVSGVPGITDEQEIMVYMIALSEKKFQSFLREQERMLKRT